MAGYSPNDIPSLDVRINGPFNDKDTAEMKALLRDFIAATGLRDDRKYFKRAMYLAKSPNAFEEERDDGLRIDDHEREMLKYDEAPVKSLEHSERTWKIDFRKWHLTGPLWRLVALCAIGAATQGWDESAVNGGQPYFQPKFNILPDKRPLIAGLVNGAPYLCSVASCWFTPFLNQRFGRRGTIFVTAILSAVFALAQAFARNWQMLFAFRLLMGLGIGPKSATIPIYSAESSPSNVRGSLVMLWQVFTAVGIMCGCVSGVIFQNVGSNNWRFMLASPMLAPVALAAYIYTQPESPRWSIAKGHTLRANGRPNGAQTQYQQAFRALEKLRLTKLQAARDMFLIYHLLESERKEVNIIRDNPQQGWYQKGVFELFTSRRNRRATVASLICMFAQQFCGVNVIIYYSNTFLSASLDLRSRLLYTMGFGIINFLFAIPAFYLIDTVGRRTLLLITFPCLALFQLWISISFALSDVWSHSWQLALAGMYLFGIAYSPGEGPVPFVYAAESMPLYIRDLGMGFVISINWLFNWLIAFTWPEFYSVFKPWGAFLWYTAWCVILWFLIFFFVPETRLLSLEQLDLVFRQPSWQFASVALQKARYNIRWNKKGIERPLGPYQTIVRDEEEGTELMSVPTRPRWTSDSETPGPSNTRRRLPGARADSDRSSQTNTSNSSRGRRRTQDRSRTGSRVARNESDSSSNSRRQSQSRSRSRSRIREHDD